MATTGTTDDWTHAPYARWLEDVIHITVLSNPSAISICMIDENGSVATSYYNVTPNDRACMIDAMHDDAMWEWLIANRAEIRAILGDESEDDDDDDDELQDADTEADSEE